MWRFFLPLPRCPSVVPIEVERLVEAQVHAKRRPVASERALLGPGDGPMPLLVPAALGRVRRLRCEAPVPASQRPVPRGIPVSSGRICCGAVRRGVTAADCGVSAALCCAQADGRWALQPRGRVRWAAMEADTPRPRNHSRGRKNSEVVCTARQHQEQREEEEAPSLHRPNEFPQKLEKEEELKKKAPTRVQILCLPAERVLTREF